MSMFDYDSEFQSPEKKKEADNLDPFWVGFWLVIIGVCCLIAAQYFGWI